MMYTLVADHDVSILVVNNFLNIDNILYDIGNSVILIYNNTHEKNVSSQRQKLSIDTNHAYSKLLSLLFGVYLNVRVQIIIPAHE